MLLCFPTIDVLRDALERDIIPAGMRAGGTAAGYDDVGKVWVQTASRMSRRLRSELRRIGVMVNAAGKPTLVPVVDWMSLLPLVPVVEDLPSTAMFCLSDARAMSSLIAEMQRLGNDRHSFCFLPRCDDVLVHVHAPPMFSLLKAKHSRNESLRAYVEQTPGVWVRWGYHQPLVEHIVPPPGEWLFIDPPRDWRTVPIVDLRSMRTVRHLPIRGAGRTEVSELRDRVALPIRLVPAPSDEQAGFWILSENGLDRLGELVSEFDDRQLERFEFAVADRDGDFSVLLKGIEHRGASPIMVGRAEAFASVQMLHGLFAPATCRLSPVLRRDAVRRLFDYDTDRVIWLELDSEQRISVHAVSSDAFRPLRDVVDHVIEEDRVLIQSSTVSAPFHWEPFTERPEPKRNSRQKMLAYEADVQWTLARAPSITFVRGSVPRATPEPVPAVPVEVPPDLSAMPDAELRDRLAEQQRMYLMIPGPPDAPARLAMLLELAAMHATLGLTGDAAWCWLNYLWRDEAPGASAVLDWLKSEQRESGAGFDMAKFETLLTEPAPRPENVRFIAAQLIASLYLSPNPLVLTQTSELAVFLERVESRLPVRAAWLAWRALSRLAGEDVLALARARDRLLNRLLETGLSRDLDLPAFVRGREASLAESVDRDQMRELYRKARQWQSGDRNIIDLTFAYGFARLGESVAANELLSGVTRRVNQSHVVDHWLLRAYQFRIEAALKQETMRGMHPALLEQLHVMGPKDVRSINLHRRASQILEPYEHIDPFRDYRTFRDDSLGLRLSQLTSLSDGGEVEDRLNELRRRAGSDRAKWRILSAAIAFAPRRGEWFAGEVLGELRTMLGLAAAEPDYAAVVFTLESALLLAGHIGRDEYLTPFADQIDAILAPLRGERLAWMLAALSGSVFRTLARVGRRDTIQRIVQGLTDRLLDGQTLDQLPRAQSVNWGIMLRALGPLAGGWFYLDRDDIGQQILELMRTKLIERTLRDEEHANLAVAYATLLGQAPRVTAWPRIHELVDRLAYLDVEYANVALHQCSRRTVEAVVLAVAGKEFVTGSRVRQWLDEDEYLVRRRIHEDFARDGRGR